MKRIITGLLSLCLAAGAFSVYGDADIETVSAVELESYQSTDEDGNECMIASDGDLDFYIYSDHAEAEVSVLGEGDTVDVVIPEECNGVKVTVLKSVYSTNGSLFSDGNPISLYLPKTLTTVSEFGLCNVSKITVDKDNPVFCDDNGVLFNKDKTELIYYPSEMQDKQYIIPESVQEISLAAFIRNKYIEEFIVDSDNDYFSVKDGVLYDRNQTKLIYYPGGKKDTEYTVPDTVSEIGDYGFSYNSCLTTVGLPDSVKHIGQCAFTEARALESISIPESVTELSPGVFGFCFYLTDVSLPDSLLRIDDNAFWLCVRLESINIPDSVEYIGRAAFAACPKLSSVKLPDGLKKIDDMTFADCKAMESLDIPSSVEKIGEGAFELSGLKNIVLPESVSEFDISALSECVGFESITILNPDCIIENKNDQCLEIRKEAEDSVSGEIRTKACKFDGTVSGYTGSTAQKFAEKWGFKFVPLDADNAEYDINEDGVVNSADLIDMIKMMIGQSEVSASADINNDGKVNVSDFLMLKKTFLRS